MQSHHFQMEVRLPATGHRQHTTPEWHLVCRWIGQWGEWLGMVSESPWVSSDHSTWHCTKSSLGFSVGVDQYVSERWAEILYVAECHFPIQWVKRICCINQWYCISFLIRKQWSHSMCGLFNAGNLPCTQLSWTAASWRSLLVIRRNAFTTILLWVSPIPIGLISGHLSSTKKQEASRRVQSLLQQSLLQQTRGACNTLNT